MTFSYIIYKIDCPFLIKNTDYRINAERRCELYNINKNSTDLYQYICSFNAEKMIFPIQIMIRYLHSKKCNKIEELIDNNEVIQAFVKEYYKEPNLYYCDLIEQPFFGAEVNPKDCDATIIIYPEILMILHIYYSIRYIILIFTYFKDIEVNINHSIHAHIS